MTQQRRQFSEAVKRRGGPAPLGLGRYQQVESAPAPANGVARPVLSENVRTALAAVPDPMDPRQRIQATVNRDVDVLERERSASPPRISEMAYRVGRGIQEAFVGERSGDHLNERVDVSTTPDHRSAREIDRARRRVTLRQHMLRRIGEENAAMLLGILVDGCSFSEWAKLHPPREGTGRAGIAFVAGNFRAQLEFVARDWDDGEMRSALRAA